MSNTTTYIELPDNEKLFTEIMLTIEVAWRNNRIDRTRIENWLSNFTGDALGSRAEEQRLALWLLYNFVFYNENEIKHLCKNLLAKYLHMQLKRLHSGPEIEKEAVAKLIEETQFLNAGYESESGAYILYLFRQENDLPLDIFKKRETMSMKYEHYAFIDDVSLSGQQAMDRINDFLYYDYELTERDFAHTFSDHLRSCKPNTIDYYIRSLLDRNGIEYTDYPGIAEAINIEVINNKDKADEIFKLASEAVKKKSDIVSLIQKKASGQLPLVGHKKLIRLLLEYNSPELFFRSVNNTQIKNIHLLVLFATETAITALKEVDVDVIYCIKLDEQSKAFSDNSVTFCKFPSLKEPCKRMCEYYGNRINPKWPLGYRDGQLLMSFYYSVPNNTLPIFWRSDNWYPLFPRHDKKKGGVVVDESGRYI